jgi:putative cardiolipin synthase
MNRRLFPAFFLLLAGCATLPTNFPAAPSNAIAPSEPTTLGRLLKSDLEAHPDLSGFHVLNLGRESIMSRVILADAADRSIDCQYFIWEGDPSGIFLLERLVQAADRGVRVRLLLDDMTTHGKDLGLAALTRHKNIQIRLFNPLGRRYYFGIFRTMAVALHAGRMTNRMHNKLFIVDNQAAIAGGRNIGDEYFGLSKRSNFRDMDLLTIGPIVPEISNAFDHYWNSPWSIPFQVVKTWKPSEKKFLKKSKQLHERFEKVKRSYPYPLDWDRKKVQDVLSQTKKDLTWAKAEVISDAPGKAWQKAERGKSPSLIVNRLESLISEAKHDLLVISPYFIVSDKTIQGMKNLRDRHVSLTVFTNSLTSTDAVPVVAMYRKTRRSILEAGSQLYEMRPDSDLRKEYADASVQMARSSLHAKVAIIDRTDVFVGTFNIDPRSENLNTEVGILVHSPALAEQIAGDLGQDLQPENSYRLQLNSKNKIRWDCKLDGTEKTYDSDPEASWWLHLKAGMVGLLPISHQL